MPKWIRFEEKQLPVNDKPWWLVVTTKDGTPIGQIFWYTGWKNHRFVLEPFKDTVWEEQCLRDIATFLEEKTKEHKERAHPAPKDS